MPTAQHGVICAGDRRESLSADRCRVAADVMVINKARRCGQNEGNGIRIANTQTGISGLGLAAFGKRQKGGLKAQTLTLHLSNQPVVGDRAFPASLHHQSARLGIDTVRVWAFQLSLHCNTPGFVAGKPHDHHAVRI